MKYIILSIIIPVLLFYRSLRFCVIKCFKSRLAQRFASFAKELCTVLIVYGQRFASFAKELHVHVCIALFMVTDWPGLSKCSLAEYISKSVLVFDRYVIQV